LAWAVKILHPNGFSTVYGHMNKIYVNAGEQVVEGQRIGQMGQTGTAFGIHVHFMVIRGSGWKQVNPAMYMKDHICGY
jgi:murein DD-endopeptidase MepM/ murein hydrolase activator NlpD